MPQINAGESIFLNASKPGSVLAGSEVDIRLNSPLFSFQDAFYLFDAQRWPFGKIDSAVGTGNPPVVIDPGKLSFLEPLSTDAYVISTPNMLLADGGYTCVLRSTTFTAPTASSEFQIELLSTSGRSLIVTRRDGVNASSLSDAVTTTNFTWDPTRPTIVIRRVATGVVFQVADANLENPLTIGGSTFTEPPGSYVAIRLRAQFIQRADCEALTFTNTTAAVAQEHITATNPHAARLTDGTAFYAGATQGQLAVTNGRFEGLKLAKTVQVTASGDTVILVPSTPPPVPLGVNGLKVYWVSAINDPDQTVSPRIRIGFTGNPDYLYSAYAIAHWEPFVGLPNQTLTCNLDQAADVAVTIHYTEIFYPD